MTARGIFEHNVRPALEDWFSDMQLPANFAEEGTLVGVDLLDR
jgi:hypothetical protein